MEVIDKLTRLVHCSSEFFISQGVEVIDELTKLVDSVPPEVVKAIERIKKLKEEVSASLRRGKIELPETKEGLLDFHRRMCLFFSFELAVTEQIQEMSPLDFGKYLVLSASWMREFE